MKNLFKQLIADILDAEARAVIRKYKPQIVAITGSVGKTSTKDAIYAALCGNAHVRKSEKSYNSEFGLPLTILGCPNAWNNPLRWLQNILDGLSLIIFNASYPKWLVLEVGADRPGDIRKVASWLPVEIAVITRLPEVPVHVEYFDSPQEVIEEKAALIAALRPSGTLVLFGDDERYRELASRTKARVITFGFSETADVRGEHFELVQEDGTGWPTGIRGTITANGSSAGLSIRGAIGPQSFLPALAAVAVGISVGKSVEEAVTAIGTNYEPPIGRMRLIPGLKGTLIIDDTYNSSPAACVAALDALTLIPKRGRRIAVLADMLELGRHSVTEHKKIGAQAAQTADVLYTVGFRARDIADGALDNGLPESNIFQYEDSEKAGDDINDFVQEGDVILVKGSQSMRMERVVEQLMADPAKASELLVRQDSEWKRR